MGENAHVLVFPFPFLGHVTPAVQLAELVSLAGLHVTFLNTEHVHRRLEAGCRSSESIRRLSSLPGFRFCSVPDGLPPHKHQLPPSEAFFDLVDSLRIHTREPFRDLLRNQLHDGGDARPPVTCVIADGLLPVTLTDVAWEEEIPAILFRTSSASNIWSSCSIPKLMQEGELPFPEGCDLDEEVRGVPGAIMNKILRRRDLPTSCRLSPTSRGFQYNKTQSQNLFKARALILNTFENLDADILFNMRSAGLSELYAVGPLHLLLDDAVSGKSEKEEEKPVGSWGLWEEDHSCMMWLDSQPNKSVVYVSFGSLATVTRRQLEEFWFGLVNSDHRFLWALRPDTVAGGGSADPPDEVATEARERGLVVEWVPQRKVLSHPAVGCFLSHSGWNSTLESIAAGVPMVCWPMAADQMINSRFVQEVWRVGLDMKDTCHRSIVEEKLRAAMEGETATQLRRSAAELATKAMSSVDPETGSSFVNFQSLIQMIKSFPRLP